MRPRQSRSDAQANLQQLLDAAFEVFSEQGAQAALDLVAERAGVSRATLYRNFADRHALMRGLLLRMLEQLQARADELSPLGPDALFAFMRDWAETVVRTTPLLDFWRSLDRSDTTLLEAQQQLRAMLEPLLDQAKQGGRCRADLSPEDLVLVGGMFGAARRGRTRDEQLALARRAWELVEGGLRASALEGAAP
ncbi:MAG: TetR/AcrR family transcriptional regulator [Comamonas sp.]